MKEGQNTKIHQATAESMEEPNLIKNYNQDKKPSECDDDPDIQIISFSYGEADHSKGYLSAPDPVRLEVNPSSVTLGVIPSSLRLEVIPEEGGISSCDLPSYNQLSDSTVSNVFSRYHHQANTVRRTDITFTKLRRKEAFPVKENKTSMKRKLFTKRSKLGGDLLEGHSWSD